MKKAILKEKLANERLKVKEFKKTKKESKKKDEK